MKAYYNFDITKKDGKEIKLEKVLAFELTAQGFFFYRLEGSLTDEKPGNYTSSLQWLRLDELSQINCTEVKEFETKLDRENYEVSLGLKNDSPKTN